MKKLALAPIVLVMPLLLSGCGQKAYVDYSTVSPKTQYVDETTQEGQVSPYNTPNANNPDAHPEETEDAPFGIGAEPGFELDGEGGLDNNNATTGIDMSFSNEESLDLIEYGCRARTPSESDNKVYIDYCGKVINPNKNLSAQYPEVIITLQRRDGSIIASDSVMAQSIAPDDTITLCGIITIDKADKTPDMEVHFDLDWGDLVVVDENEPKSTDFITTGVSERFGSNDGLITGEIINGSSKDADNVCVSLLLKNNGKIVYIDTTYVDKLAMGNKKTFQFSCLGGWPEHTDVEISAQPW